MPQTAKHLLKPPNTAYNRRRRGKAVEGSMFAPNNGECVCCLALGAAREAVRSGETRMPGRLKM
eukprot:1726789-Alexandrium_andersonii.AAC.1